jgi:hypothetical protein
MLKKILVVLIVALIGVFVFPLVKESGKAIAALMHAAGISPAKAACIGHSNISEANYSLLPALTPWTSVGGCGGGGSGGGGASAKWVGNGVTGGLIDFQGLCTYFIAQNNNSFTFSPRFSYKPGNSNQTVGVSFPIVSKTASNQPKTNMVEVPGNITGGLGDIALDYSMAFGMIGEYALNVSLSLPTAQYDIKRGKDFEKFYLPMGLQKGAGTYNASLGLGYTKDVEDGMWLVDLSYAHGFAINFKGKNQFINNQKDQYNDLYKMWDSLSSKEKERFEYYFKPYAENDLGAYTPPSVTASVYFGDKKSFDYKGLTHSWGVTFSVPIGVAWIPYYDCKTYDPRPDPDHQTWKASLNYGLEIHNPTLPLFIAISLPVHDQTAANSTTSPKARDEYDTRPMAHWDPPDWKDIGQQWGLSVGMKATLF